MNLLINFITSIEARSSLAHFHQILSTILILGGIIGSSYFTVPAEYWVVTSTFIGNGGAIFEFLFNKRKNEPK
jgi:hypothetical protein